MRIERGICPLTMLVERSMLTMRIESSICPLTMLVERSNAYREEHLSERSIVPLNSSGNWLRHHHSETRQIPSGQTDRASCIADSKAAERNKVIFRTLRSGWSDAWLLHLTDPIPKSIHSLGRCLASSSFGSFPKPLIIL